MNWHYMRNWWAYLVGHILEIEKGGFTLLMFTELDKELFW
jgi:hypothetical protein